MRGKSQERDCWVCREESLITRISLLSLGVLALQNRSKDETQAGTAIVQLTLPFAGASLL